VFAETKEGVLCPPAVMSGVVTKVSTSALNRDARNKKFLAVLEDGRLCYYPTKQVKATINFYPFFLLISKINKLFYFERKKFMSAENFYVLDL
jgi:hypothetical protein